MDERRLARIVDPFVRFLIRGSGRYVFLTDTERQNFVTWLKTPVVDFDLIGNGTEIRQTARTLPSNPSTALFLARLAPRKNPQAFALAARHSFDSSLGDNTIYVLAGPDSGSLQETLKLAHGLPNFKYIGPIKPDSVRHQINSSDIFVLTSRDEPWGNVLVQALAEAIPVVVARSAALAPAIDEARAGIVVDEDQPAEVASAIRRILDSYSSYSHAALSLANDQFMRTKLNRRLTNMYRSLLPGPVL